MMLPMDTEADRQVCGVTRQAMGAGSQTATEDTSLGGSTIRHSDAQPLVH